MVVDAVALARDAKQYTYRLLLMRHAQAQSAGQGTDRMRPLSSLGLKQAVAMGKSLTRLSLIPDRIACSGASRTRQTLDQMLESFGDGPKVEYKESLYAEGPQAVFDLLEASKPEEHELLIVTHEPTVSMTAQLLASAESDQGAVGLLDLGMVPANVAILASNDPFNAWQLHHARYLGLFGPKHV